MIQQINDLENEMNLIFKISEELTTNIDLPKNQIDSIKQLIKFAILKYKTEIKILKYKEDLKTK